MDGQSEIITLNVGGDSFTTNLSTLQKYADSWFGKKFCESEWKDVMDNPGKYFIDRNGKYFKHILEFLRDKSYRPPVKVVRKVYDEAIYYGLRILSDALKPRPADTNDFPLVSPSYPTIRRNISRFGSKTTLQLHLKTADDTFFPKRTYDVLGTEPSFPTGSASVTQLNTIDEAHSMIQSLVNDLHLDGFDADIDVIQFSGGLVCKVDVKQNDAFTN